MLEPGARALAAARGLEAVLAAARGEAELESGGCGVLFLRGLSVASQARLVAEWAELGLSLLAQLPGLSWAERGRSAVPSCLG